MFGHRIGFGVLAIACVVAAGAGGYLASRQNAVTPAPLAAAPASPVPAPAVQETEAVVGDTAKSASRTSEPSAPSSKSFEPSAPSSLATRRAESGARTQAAAPIAKPERRATQAARNERPAARPLEHSWPSSANQTPADNGQNAPAPADASTLRPDEVRPAEATRAPEPPAKTFEELVIASNSVIGLQMESPVSSETARVEDRVEARVVRDVRVTGQVAVPAGAKAIGAVMSVERGGKFKERARLGIRFHTLVLADGSRLPITTETIYRDGQSPGNESAAKVGGGAAVGTIVGAIIGGAKGAAVGAAVGAGGGTAAVMAGERNAATFPVGSEVTARLMSPVTVTIDK